MKLYYYRPVSLSLHLIALKFSFAKLRIYIYSRVSLNLASLIFASFTYTLDINVISFVS